MLCIFFTSSWIYINSDWRSHILTVFLARSCTSRPAVKSSPLTHVRAVWRPARQDFKTGGKRLHLFHFHPLPKASALFRSHTGLTGRSAVLPPGQWRGVCRGDQSDLALPQRLGSQGWQLRMLSTISSAFTLPISFHILAFISLVILSQWGSSERDREC